MKLGCIFTKTRYKHCINTAGVVERAVLCRTENTFSVYSGLKCHKELQIDLISLDYLLLIKLSSSYARILSICLAVRQGLQRGSFTVF